MCVSYSAVFVAFVNPFQDIVSAKLTYKCTLSPDIHKLNIRIVFPAEVNGLQKVREREKIIAEDLRKHSLLPVNLLQPV